MNVSIDETSLLLLREAYVPHTDRGFTISETRSDVLFSVQSTATPRAFRD